MPFDCNISGVVVGSVIGTALALLGYGLLCIVYVRGYRAGLDYGMKALEEYHEHTMQGLRELK